MSNGFNEIIGNYFTKEEWNLWVKGEFNLFDNFVERTGMTEADAQRLKAKINPLQPSTLPQKTLTKEEIKHILNTHERNNT